MKYLHVPKRGQRGQWLSKADLAKADEIEGRRRLNAGELQAMLYLAVGRYLLEEGFDRLGGFVREAGAHRRLASAIPMVHNAVQPCANRMSCAQLIAMADNLEQMTVTMSATPIGAEGGCLNIRYNALDALCGQALHACDLCAKTRDQSRDCPVRKAFDQIPVLQLAARQIDMGAEACPYQGLAVPVDE